MNKGIAVLSTALVLTLGLTWYNSANAQAKKGEKGFIVGHVIDIATYTMRGQIEEIAESHKNRIEKGLGFKIHKTYITGSWSMIIL